MKSNSMVKYRLPCGSVAVANPCAVTCSDTPQE